MTLFTDPLDALLASAKQQAYNTKVKPHGEDKRKAVIKEAFSTLYTNPDNWNHTRNIALIHEAPNGVLTLLGCFHELTHKKVRGVRELKRATEPMAIDAEEIVTGTWWLSPETLQRIKAGKEEERIDLQADLQVDDLEVYALKVPIRVYLHNGVMLRIELGEKTQFVCPTNKRLVFLPAGLDVMEGLSRNTKIQIRGALGL